MSTLAPPAVRASKSRAMLHEAPTPKATTRNDTSSVRLVVASWRNRWPGAHHSDADLLPSMEVLQRHEAELAAYSSHAVRLYGGLQAEWQRRYPVA